MNTTKRSHNQNKLYNQDRPPQFGALIHSQALQIHTPPQYMPGNVPYVVANGVAIVLPTTSVNIGAAMVVISGAATSSIIIGAATTSANIGAAMVIGAAIVVIAGAATNSVIIGAAMVLWS